MNANELVAWARDFKLVGPLLSERAVRVLFAYVQHDEEIIGELEENGRQLVDEGDDDEMVFAEYLESIMAVGSQLYPDPYNVLNIRIDRFVQIDVVQKALKMVRFVNKGLKKNRRLSLVRSSSRRGSFDKIDGSLTGGNGSSSVSRRGSFTGSRRPSFSQEMKRKSFSERSLPIGGIAGEKDASTKEQAADSAKAKADLDMKKLKEAIESGVAETIQQQRETVKMIESVIERSAVGGASSSASNPLDAVDDTLKNVNWEDSPGASNAGDNKFMQLFDD